MKLTVEVYRLTKVLPADELYGLVSQMRRSAVSLPSNIAEGFQRAGRADQGRFMQIAYASAAELETQLELCRQLHYLNETQTADADGLVTEVQRMLNTIIQQLKS